MGKSIEWTPGMDEMVKTARGSERVSEVARYLGVGYRVVLVRRAMLRDGDALNHRWTTPEVRQLRDWALAGKKAQWMADQMGLGVGKIYQQLNLLRRQGKLRSSRWTPEEDQQLLAGATSLPGRTFRGQRARKALLARREVEDRGEGKIDEGAIRT